MNYRHFMKLLNKVADNITEDKSKGEVVFSYYSEVHYIKTIKKSGDIYVVDKTGDMKAETWITTNLVKLRFLAERILEKMSSIKIPAFITPKGESDYVVVDGELIDGEIIQSNDLVNEIRTIINGDSIANCSEIFWLLSDAGEGKSTTIHELVRLQATEYLKNPERPLVIPIDLGGEQFIHLDHLIIGTIVNYFKFHYLSWDILVELIRMKKIIIVLDGFEELLVDMSNDMFQSLSSFVEEFDSEGQIIIASRKAYFSEASPIRARILMDFFQSGINNYQFKISRWKENDFIRYCEKRQISYGNKIYSKLVSIIRDDHPILTRPFLVNKLIDIILDVSNDTQKDLNTYIKDFFSSSANFLSSFIVEAINRENLKWKDKFKRSGLLLTLDEHLGLLELFASEMWLNQSQSLSYEYCDLWIEEYIQDIGKKDLTAVKQISERIKNHAILVPIDRSVLFEHDEFRFYFLASFIAKQIIHNNNNNVNRLLSIAILTESTVKCIIDEIPEQNVTVTINYLKTFVAVNNSYSFLNTNIAKILQHLLSFSHEKSYAVESLYFDFTNFSNPLENIEFQKCNFEVVDLLSSSISKCLFKDCLIKTLVINRTELSNDITFINSDIKFVVFEDHSEVYDPKKIDTIIGKYFGHNSSKEICEFSLDNNMKIVSKITRLLRRSSMFSEGLLIKEQGKSFTSEINDVLSDLTRNNILVATENKSVPGKMIYRYVLPVNVVTELIERSNGDYSEFKSLALKDLVR